AGRPALIVLSLVLITAIVAAFLGLLIEAWSGRVPVRVVVAGASLAIAVALAAPRWRARGVRSHASAGGLGRAHHRGSSAGAALDRERSLPLRGRGADPGRAPPSPVHRPALGVPSRSVRGGDVGAVAAPPHGVRAGVHARERSDRANVADVSRGGDPRVQGA